MKRGQLIVVANRLPVTVEREGGELRVRRSSGGLVSALWPIFQESGGYWVGWPGWGHDQDLATALHDENTPHCKFHPVLLDEAEQEGFYGGWSNEIIWPLFHDLQSKCRFDASYWEAHCNANEKFADAVAAIAERGSFIWVHDYHLMMLAEALRERGILSKLAYFHHIPFPPADIFEKLPWRREILRALLQFTLLGFQTERDRRNFTACVQRCFPEAHVERDSGKVVVAAAGVRASVGVFPVGINYEALASEAASPEVSAGATELRCQLNHRKIILGLDRLDYTKGILQRLSAFRALLEKEPALREKITLVQVAVPSRETIPNYQQLKTAIERLVGEINGEFGTFGWNPVCYWHRSLCRTELLSLYRAADIAFITPLKDGMNLVAKEFCASRVDGSGVLILSEFAGAAAELSDGAVLVNPYDTDGMTAALVRALRMGPGEQRSRMYGMRRTIEKANVFEWCRAIWHEAGFNGPGETGTGPMARTNYAALAV